MAVFTIQRTHRASLYRKARSTPATGQFDDTHAWTVQATLDVTFAHGSGSTRDDPGRSVPVQVGQRQGRVVFERTGGRRLQDHEGPAGPDRRRRRHVARDARPPPRQDDRRPRLGRNLRRRVDHGADPVSTVKVSIDPRKLRDGSERGMRDFCETGARSVRNRVLAYVNDAPGRTGEEYFIPGTLTRYVASAPGEAPATRTGQYLASWEVLPPRRRRDGWIAYAFSGLAAGPIPLGIALEDGTEHMGPRPHLLPVMTQFGQGRARTGGPRMSAPQGGSPPHGERRRRRVDARAYRLAAWQPREGVHQLARLRHPAGRVSSSTVPAGDGHRPGERPELRRQPLGPLRGRDDPDQPLGVALGAPTAAQAAWRRWSTVSSSCSRASAGRSRASATTRTCGPSRSSRHCPASS